MFSSFPNAVTLTSLTDLVSDSQQSVGFIGEIPCDLTVTAMVTAKYFVLRIEYSLMFAFPFPLRS